MQIWELERASRPLGPHHAACKVPPTQRLLGWVGNQVPLVPDVSAVAAAISTTSLQAEPPFPGVDGEKTLLAVVAQVVHVTTQHNIVCGVVPSGQPANKSC